MYLPGLPNSCRSTQPLLCATTPIMQGNAPERQPSYGSGPASIPVRASRRAGSGAQPTRVPAPIAGDGRAAEAGVVPYDPTDAELRAYSLERQLEAARRRIARLQVLLGYFFVAATALGLRGWFVVRVNKIPPVWDADLYWRSMLAARDALCQQFHYCTAVEPTGQTLETLLYDAATQRTGLIPLLGAVMTVLPRETLSVHLLHAFFDTLVCLMVVGIARRLGLPLWAALIAGLFQAFYVPTITGDGSVIQQPYIRLFLVAAVWAYTYAFTTSSFRRWLWAGAGTVLSVIVGFTSITNRPLMWLIPLLVIVLALLRWRMPGLAIAQVVLVAAVVVALLLFTDQLYKRIGSEDARTVPFTGLSSLGSVGAQSTVLTYDHFWPVDDWGNLGRNTSETILKDVEKSPAEFAEWWNYSLYANWQYPDYTYFQVYLLDYDGQKLQHWLLLVMGTVGLLAMLGVPGPPRKVVLLMLGVVLVASLLPSIISVEPRRVSVLTPFLSVGLGAFCVGAVSFATRGARRAWALRRARPLLWALWALLVGFLVWSIPLRELIAVAPDAAGVLHVVVVLLHAIGAVVVAAAACVIARRVVPTYRPWLPVLAGAALMVIIAAAQLRDPDWRGWSIPVNGTVRQTIMQVPGEEHLQPWLLVDAGSAAEMQLATVRVDGRIVKQSGESPYLWRAGVPPLWFAYEGLINIASQVPPMRTWLAVPLPRDLVSDGAATVEIDPHGSPFTLYGDYLDSPVAAYAGPPIQPWNDANSFWRWQWNANDPRITAPQDFGSNNYSGVQAQAAGPGSPDKLEQPLGLYRVFLAWEAFGPRTNALLTPGGNPRPSSTPPMCPLGTLLAGENPSLPFVCQNGNDVMYYLNGDVLMGLSNIAEFAHPFQPYDLMKSMGSPQGRVDVVGALRSAPDGSHSLFVANTYNSAGELLYSIAFWLALPPS